MGKSAATNINVNIIRMEDNEYNSVEQENIFEYYTFDLYPTEQIEAIISTLETKVLTDYPIVYIEVSYTEKISGKMQNYDRSVICNRNYVRKKKERNR